MDIESPARGPLFAAADAVGFPPDPSRRAGRSWAASWRSGFALRASGPLQGPVPGLRGRGQADRARGRPSACLLRELVRRASARAVAVLPTVAVVLVGPRSFWWASRIPCRGWTRSPENRARTSELSAVVRNLERRYRVVDVRVLSADGRTARLALAFYDSRTPGKLGPDPRRRPIEGSEVFVDALVLRFRLLRDRVRPEGEPRPAVPGLRQTSRRPRTGKSWPSWTRRGVPLLYRRAEAESLRHRSAGLRRGASRSSRILLEDEEARRRAGIVRSVFGAAVRRRVRAGDSFTIWVRADRRPRDQGLTSGF
ncbi:MAG: hypothetical protein M0C28_21890 [Candidatus Moduliflexus flocculans]|nr:hypothetical protein [Candidatus Moduliflexus flocculans]